jgi:hypothetical protein
MVTTHWCLSARLHQEKIYNITIDKSRYAKSIVRHYLDSAGVKRVNSPHTYILPIDFIPTIEDKESTPEADKKIQEAYIIDYASCIGSLVYVSYKRPYIAFAVKKLAQVHLLRYIRVHSKLGLTYYSNDNTAPFYKLLQEHNITPTRKLFTFSDSSWQD